MAKVWHNMDEKPQESRPLRVVVSNDGHDELLRGEALVLLGTWYCDLCGCWWPMNDSMRNSIRQWAYAQEVENG